MIAFAVSPVWGHEAPEGFWAYSRIRVSQDGDYVPPMGF